MHIKEWLVKIFYKKAILYYLLYFYIYSFMLILYIYIDGVDHLFDLYCNCCIFMSLL